MKFRHTSILCLALLVASILLTPTAHAATTDIYYLMPDSIILANQKGQVIIPPVGTGTVTRIYDQRKETLDSYVFERSSPCYGFKVGQTEPYVFLYACLSPDAKRLTDFCYADFYVANDTLYGVNDQLQLVSLAPALGGYAETTCINLGELIPGAEGKKLYNGHFFALPNETVCLNLYFSSENQTDYDFQYAFVLDKNMDLLFHREGSIREISDTLLAYSIYSNTQYREHLLDYTGKPMGNDEGYSYLMHAYGDFILSQEDNQPLCLSDLKTGSTQLLDFNNIYVSDVFKDLFVVSYTDEKDAWRYQAYGWDGQPLLPHAVAGLRVSEHSLILEIGDKGCVVYSRTGTPMTELPLGSDLRGDWIQYLDQYKKYYMDTQGESHLLPDSLELPFYTNVRTDEGFVVMESVSQQVGLMDHQGNLLVQPTYQYMEQLSTGALAGSYLCTSITPTYDQYKNLMLKDHQLLLADNRYSSLIYEDEKILFRQHNTFGMLDTTGKELWRINLSPYLYSN